MPKRTPEDVCIEYAIAAAWVKEQQAILTSHSCTATDVFEDGARAMGDECISLLWATTGEDDHGRAVADPQILECDMCDNCKIRLKAINERKLARARYGAAKRAVLAVGKRLNMEAL